MTWSQKEDGIIVDTSKDSSEGGAGRALNPPYLITDVAIILTYQMKLLQNRSIYSNRTV